MKELFQMNLVLVMSSSFISNWNRKTEQDCPKERKEE